MPKGLTLGELIEHLQGFNLPADSPVLITENYFTLQKQVVRHLTVNDVKYENDINWSEAINQTQFPEGLVIGSIMNHA